VPEAEGDSLRGANRDSSWGPGKWRPARTAKTLSRTSYSIVRDVELRDEPSRRGRAVRRGAVDSDRNGQRVARQAPVRRVGARPAVRPGLRDCCARLSPGRGYADMTLARSRHLFKAHGEHLCRGVLWRSFDRETSRSKKTSARQRAGSADVAAESDRRGSASQLEVTSTGGVHRRDRASTKDGAALCVRLTPCWYQRSPHGPWKRRPSSATRQGDRNEGEVVLRNALNGWGGAGITEA